MRANPPCLARGARTDVRRKPNVRRVSRAAVPQPFEKQGARDVYRVQGASLSGFGLMDGDVVYAKPLARRAMRAAVGSMIVFALNGAFYLKRLTIAPGGVIELRSAHPGYDPMKLRPDDNFELLGQIVASVRQFHGGS
jgi:SOS-response transcriptional repressor LexA